MSVCACRVIKVGPRARINYCGWHQSVDQMAERVAAAALALDGALRSNTALEARIAALEAALAEARERENTLAAMNDRLFAERDRARDMVVELTEVLERRRRGEAVTA